jgi:hypothetical protein
MDIWQGLRVGTLQEKIVKLRIHSNRHELDMDDSKIPFMLKESVICTHWGQRGRCTEDCHNKLSSSQTPICLHTVESHPVLVLHLSVPQYMSTEPKTHSFHLCSGRNGALRVSGH